MNHLSFGKFAKNNMKRKIGGSMRYRRPKYFQEKLKSFEESYLVAKPEQWKESGEIDFYGTKNCFWKLESAKGSFCMNFLKEIQKMLISA